MPRMATQVPFEEGLRIPERSSTRSPHICLGLLFIQLLLPRRGCWIPTTRVACVRLLPVLLLMRAFDAAGLCAAAAAALFFWRTDASTSSPFILIRRILVNRRWCGGGSMESVCCGHGKFDGKFDGVRGFVRTAGSDARTMFKLERGFSDRAVDFKARQIGPHIASLGSIAIRFKHLARKRRAKPRFASAANKQQQSIRRAVVAVYE